ncbi:hypothetical protein BCR32DRAFT_239985 [Anaeromyces robustus]|uniref:Uncharacterized protein n=1 Tax=Anaeromyces robustus TaxID=1754192 RepID=A0A1Y1XPL6_9FUNG|nr:hypothetical protein BCR32DRAFT_239985 [Anaeromyces robustus]|eukprot:ORX87687.1 hypothetical protein BCR32DRAFT_239985 [Anaeromyces robustus]
MKYTSQDHKVELIKYVENRYSKWLEKYKQKDEKDKKENIKRKRGKSIINDISFYDGYYLFPNETNNINNKRLTKRFIKNNNHRIAKVENELLYKYNSNNNNGIL